MSIEPTVTAKTSNQAKMISESFHHSMQEVKEAQKNDTQLQSLDGLISELEEKYQ